MLIYDVLKKDHEVVKDLLEKMEATKETAPKSRIALLERLRNELIPHARAEEKVLYDTLKDIESTKELALEAYEQFGKGRHRAALNFGDCLTYAVAKVAQQPLLCVGNDFSKTDLKLA